MKTILNLVKRHKGGELIGLYSICSAHPIVIEAAMRVALESGQAVLIEATSNQVNQDGGYTGMVPHDFHAFVMAIADKIGLPSDKVWLGGDHLGPNCWQSLTAEEAMARSRVLIESYVEAGFRKIHLDCSMSCADDPFPLGEEASAERAAQLCAVAEATWQHVGGEPPVYVIGTEVPVPGGAQETLHDLHVTTPDAASSTIIAHRKTFRKHGLNAVWPRVIALVVQPGVEFDHHNVIDYHPAEAQALSLFIQDETHLVFEAHSTDYQTPERLNDLVRDHFAILKVGPGLSFALREALWALADIEREWLGQENSSHFKEIVLAVMNDKPGYWKKYYSDPATEHYDLQFSLSDRIRYYWSQPEIRQAQEHMVRNLEQYPPPLALLSQYLPRQYDEIRAGELDNSPHEILLHAVAVVIRQYHGACSAHASCVATAVE